MATQSQQTGEGQERGGDPEGEGVAREVELGMDEVKGRLVGGIGHALTDIGGEGGLGRQNYMLGDLRRGDCFSRR